MIKHKAMKIFIVVVAAILALVLIVAGVLFFPLNGKRHVEIWSAEQAFDMSKIQKLEKQPGEPFDILLLTDIQLWTNPADNKRAFAQIKELVEKTKPDLMIAMGDNVSGVTSRFLINDVVKNLDSFEIPWAVVFGNHDNEIPMTTLNWQGDKYEDSKYCLFEKGPSNLYGCGNYVINITEQGKSVQSLFLFDNGRYAEYEDGSNKEIYMGYEQIAWYEWNVKGITESAGGIVPSMTFSHFAQPEFREAVEKYSVPTGQGEGYNIPKEYGFGQGQYLPGAAPVKSGFFAKCKELGSTRYMFCGHDHENDASVTYDGITMTYGLKTGPSPAPWNNATQTGGTVISISNADTNYAVNVRHIPLEKG